MSSPYEDASPLLGGSLSRPQARFPKFFGDAFWKNYPYFLPCLVASSYVAFSFVITLLYFKEVRIYITVLSPCLKYLFQTLPKRQKYQKGSAREDEEKPLPLRKVLVYPVILSISNYAVLAFLFTALMALLPLFLAMPLDIGGLDLDPPVIGYIIGPSGLASGIFQALYFPPVVRRFGERKVFIMAISTFLPIFLSLPVINMAAVTLGRQSPVVWLLIFVLLTCMAFSFLGFSKFLTNAISFLWPLILF